MTRDTDIADDERTTEEPGVGRPYGVFGLLVSLIVILALAILFCLLAGALAFGFAVLSLGWQPTLDRLGDFAAAARPESILLQRAGIVGSLFIYAAISLAVWVTARFRAGAHWRDLIGWKPWQPFRGSRVFWIVAAITIAYSLGADALVSRLYPPSSDWVVLPTGPIWIALFVILAVVFAPFAEEIIFRGWLYTGLRAKIGVWAAILTTSALFALAHWEKTHLYALAVFPVGLALGFVRERTGSLKASMTFHAVYNAAASALLVFGPH